MEPDLTPSISLLFSGHGVVTAHQGDWAGFNWAALDGNWSLMIPLHPKASKVRTYYDQASEVAVDKPAGMAPAFPRGFRWGRKFNCCAYSDDAPYEGTWEEGDILFNRVAHSSQGPWSGWIGAICTQGGTTGNYDEALTATSDGSNVVVLSSATSRLEEGQYIVLNNVMAQIVSIDEGKTSVTLTNVVPAGQSLPIAYESPEWRKFGQLEHEQ